MTVDLERATLNDFVEDFVQCGLGYEDREFVVMLDSAILFDADEDQNLSKKLVELDIGDSTVLTLGDESDDDPFVDVRVIIQAA